MMIVDAEGAILGRLAANVAKRLLLGEEVVVVNAEKAVVTGGKKHILAEYKEMHDKGHRYKGPFFPKEPHMIVKRTVRGMLPWKTSRGRDAFKRLKVHIGVPEELAGQTAEKIERISIGRSNAPRFTRVEEVARFLGWKPKM
jgi:large subunit ribosomal protein L13